MNFGKYKEQKKKLQRKKGNNPFSRHRYNKKKSVRQKKRKTFVAVVKENLLCQREKNRMKEIEFTEKTILLWNKKKSKSFVVFFLISNRIEKLNSFFFLKKKVDFHNRTLKIKKVCLWETFHFENKRKSAKTKREKS